MKISQLIKKLEKYKNQYGNLPVQVIDVEKLQVGYYSTTDLFFVLNEVNGKVKSLELIDRNLWDLLRG